MTDVPSLYGLGQIPYLTSGKWKIIPKSRGGRSLSVQAMSIKQIQGKYAQHKYKEMIWEKKSVIVSGIPAYMRGFGCGAAVLCAVTLLSVPPKPTVIIGPAHCTYLCKDDKGNYN